MIKPSWDVFKAKFSENPQYNFEWFCYLLFCKEFNKEFGISRYINQAGLETDTIEVDSEVIGWQAKFYETALSNHKDELLDTLEKSKKYYPDITKLIFYTSQEWGQNKGKKPKGLIEIENKAQELNIKLEWKCASFFESEFVCNTNKLFAKHFFALEKSIFDLLEEQKQHTQNILSEIHPNIFFNEQSIEIDRNNYLEELKKQSRKISILSGVGGVGKTVLIQKLYEHFKDKIPFFVFKATEFELRNINDLFKDFTFYDFIEANRDYNNKIIVIDSAEKLLDLNNSDPFREFLSVLIKDKWQIIFTTRNHYLENLNYDFFEIYNIVPLNININNLEQEELITLSEKYFFLLPKDEKLLDLIKNPFYLNEYLKFYTEANELNYSDFKARLWTKNIKKSKPERERCFFKIAYERAANGQFFISPNCESNILLELLKDGILGYEEAGYFITHDIYEEWALEKTIEIEYIKSANEVDFFDKIGQSLPIRRSFRNWLSEKLLLEDENIKTFIENVIDNQEIEQFWKDELLVSILISNYSEVFFNFFKNELLKNEQKLLKRITFILRITCKDIDNDFFEQIGIKNLNLLSLKYVLTKPKGQGWKNLIKFVFDNIKTIGIKNINFILPIVHDWNSKIKDGETTRFSSLIALQFYQWTIKDDVYFSNDNTKENLFQTILYGTSEMKDELKGIFDEILKNKWKNHNDPYCDLSEFILTKLEGIYISKILPEFVLKLADLFWTYTPQKDDNFYRSSIEVEQHFGVENNRSDYHPASAYQTPIYWLLQSNLKETVDFILDFTNKSVQKYAVSGFDSFVQNIEVYIDEESVKKQYISHCLWNMYRGIGSPISPYLLQSLHMALEKYFLEMGKTVKASTLESWLIYLLRNSESASISSIVASIVLAYPDKTFNVAKILFKTKEFILNDTTRLIADHSAKSLYSIGSNWGVSTNKFYDEERIKTCEDKHRKTTLENLFFNYQFFRNEQISQEEVEIRQKELWDILDTYYKELPTEKEENESDKTWRLYLARIDRRKMDITTEETDEGVVIKFNPELTPELKEYSEKALTKSSEHMKYTSLKIWADYKFKQDEKYKQYEQYESNPKLALKEVKDIVEKLKTVEVPDSFKVKHSDDESFYLFNHTISAYVCSVLVRDNFEDLNIEEKEFCKDIILEVAVSSFRPNYRYQISDGVQQVFSLLPVLLELFPQEKENIKTILFLGLFQDGHVGGMLEDESFSIFSIMAINKLWENNFDDAQSFLYGYLVLKPKYDGLREKLRQENYKKNIYNSHGNIWEIFFEENKENLNKIFECKLQFNDIKNIEKLDLFTLRTVFKLIPMQTVNKDYKKIVKVIILTFANNILSNDRDEKIDYTLKHDFFKQYVHFVLNLPQDEIQDYLQPFLDNFNNSESVADLLKEFVLAEDTINAYDNFWFVWSVFKEKIFELCKNGDGYGYIDKIIRSYLFAEVGWKETAKEWRSFKDKDKRFFKEISENIGHCPSTLYSISKLLNDIGSTYIDDGLLWISTILDKNKDYPNKKLENNTIYYMEHFIRKYIFKNREKIKKTIALKNKLIIILNFLIEKGSVVGYMLREKIV